MLGGVLCGCISLNICIFLSLPVGLFDNSNKQRMSLCFSVSIVLSLSQSFLSLYVWFGRGLSVCLNGFLSPSLILKNSVAQFFGFIYESTSKND